jgi:hypothetical protein
MLSIMVVLAYIPTTVYEDTFSPTFSPAFVVVVVLDANHCHGGEVES